MDPLREVYSSWARTLQDELPHLDLGPSVSAVYHPLTYAFEPFGLFLERIGSHPRPLLFLGMNPGPWGMTQTGVPFGSVPLVRDWMGLTGPVGRPPVEHPARPVEGFACRRTEVSGTRFWGLMGRRWGSLEGFARGAAVHSFCPLVFMDEGGRNLTPDRLPAPARRRLEASGAEVARTLVRLWSIEATACLGRWAFDQARAAGLPRPLLLPHPSPIHPGSRNWDSQVEALLVAEGLWPAQEAP